MSPPTEAAELFANWSIYRAVIESNCMEHREISAAVREILERRLAPFSLLDLGCGDAASVGPALSGTAVRRYVGVDFSEPALALARGTLAGLEAEIELHAGNFLDLIQGAGERFDVILISFVLHHLDSAAKRRFLAAARERLAPGGELLLVDVIRRDGETRDQYLERYADYVARWPVGSEKQGRLMSHIRGFDFPEELSTQPAWAAELGFGTVETFYRGAEDTQCAWRLAVA